MAGSQVRHLVVLGGHIELTGAFELTVHSVPGHSGLDGVEVLPAQGRQALVLLRQVRLAVVVAVGEAGGAESAVAPRGGPADGVRFDEHDVPVGGAFLGLQRRPQSREPAADDEEFGVQVLGQRRQR